MARKSTSAEVALREEEVMELLFRRATRQEIVRYASGKWGVGSRQVDDYIAGARRRITRLGDYDAKEKLGEAIHDLEQLLRVAIRDRDWRLVKDTRKLLSEHYGILVDKHSVDTNVTAELIKMIEEGEQILNGSN